MSFESKTATYDEASVQLEALLENLTDPVAIMATVAAVLFHSLPGVSWVGFYRVVGPDLLRVGPYQGPVGCLEIAFGKGVCGTAAQREEAQIVPDVHAFPGHIACDAQARSEIVLPVHDAAGNLVAVLDLDSHLHACFNEQDLEHLQRILRRIRDSL